MKGFMELQLGFKVSCEMVSDYSAREKAQAIIGWPRWVAKHKVDYVKSLRCFENIRELCISNLPPIEIARQIQLYGEGRELQVASLANYIEHYKATVPKGLIVRRANPHFATQRKKAEEELNVNEELVKLYQLMYKRVNIAVNREETIGFLLPNVEKSFAVALDYLKELGEVRKTLGFEESNERAKAISKEIDWDRIYVRPGMNKVLEDPAARGRIVRFVESMTSLFGNMPEEKQQQLLDHVRRKKELEQRQLQQRDEDEEIV